MATNRRPRPSGGRHPPPLAPTVNTFKPRAEWSNASSSMFLYLNLPGFYKDQIQITSNEKARTIQIQGQRPLSTHTKARFNEIYRVPESCDMTKIKTSFLHGLLTIEIPILQATERPAAMKARELQGKPTQKRADDGAAVGRKQPPKDEKPAETGGVSASAKDEKVVEERKGKPEEKVKEERGRASVTYGSLELKKREKQVMQLSGQKAKEEEEEGRTAPHNDSLSRTLQEKGGVVAAGGSARQEKENVSIHGGMSEQKMKQREEVNGGFGSKEPKKEEKLVEEKANEGQIRDLAKHEKPLEGDSGKDLAEETHDEIANMKPGLEKEAAKVEKVRKPDDNIKKPVAEGEGTKKTTERGTESEIFQDNTSVIAKDQREINGGRKLSSYADELRKNLLQRKDEEQLQKHGYSLVNVGVAALVIMGFGAYVFLPLLKLFY